MDETPSRGRYSEPTDAEWQAYSDAAGITYDTPEEFLAALANDFREPK